MLLDEATSALDKTNERMVQEAIDRYRENNGDISTITIAHRLSTIRYADKIVALVNGVLTENGTHDELMSNNPDGVYAGFYNMQAS
jgi:ABC-type multidrug transport system fused ATPase/permease subunit